MPEMMSEERMAIAQQEASRNQKKAVSRREILSVST